MNIKIIKENKIKPQNIKFPLQNADFLNISYPITNAIEAKEGDLNIFMHREVYEAIWQHSKSELSLEIGGALLGIYGHDNGKEFVLITGILNQPLSYYQSQTMLRFTKQFYDDLDDYISQINRKYPNVIRLGLYHTHPNYGVFLSTTDAKTFKGIFKEKYQIAMVVDPIKNQDGVFYWQGKDISKRAAFRLYDSDNPNFCFHQYTTNNKHIENDNPHLVLDNSRPTITAVIRQNEDEAVLTEKNNHFQSFFSQTKKETKAKNKLLKLDFNKTRAAIVEGERNILKIKSLSFLPKICPLYDMQYRSKQINLQRYIRSLSEKPQKKFPYMIFIDQKTYDKIQLFWQKKQAIAGLLKGKLCYDMQKKVYFLYLNNVVLLENVGNERATSFIHDFYKNHIYKNETDLLGWIYVHTGLPPSSKDFALLQQQLFDKSHHLGFVIKSEYMKAFDLSKADLIAHNFEKNETFDYFGNTFLCEAII